VNSKNFLLESWGELQPTELIIKEEKIVKKKGHSEEVTGKQMTRKSLH